MADYVEDGNLAFTVQIDTCYTKLKNTYRATFGLTNSEASCDCIEPSQTS